MVAATEACVSLTHRYANQMDFISALFVGGVLLIIGGSWIAPRIGLAAPILLTVVGIGIGYIPGLEPLEIEPEWILAIVLPPILYAAAVNVPITDFRRNFKAISGLSVILVILSAVAIGFLLTWLMPGLPLAAAIALGAVVSPPDAVAATSIGKRLGLPGRLVTVLEGEGLVNDATALVLLRSAIAAIGGSVTIFGVAADFVFAVVVAVLIGLVVGLVTVWARARIDQPTLTTAISFVVPFLAYLPAESVHASGVLAVVIAGLVTGHKALRHLSVQDRITERMNWRTAQLLLENGVFLVMGYQMAQIVTEVGEEGASVWATVGIGLVVTVALILLRAVFMVPLLVSLRSERRRATNRAARADQFLERIDGMVPHGEREERRLTAMRKRLGWQRTEWNALARDGLGWRGGLVLTWSGMRGVVTLAAAQSLPFDVPFRSQLILIAFTVALVTLVLHGTTLPVLIRMLGVSGTDAEAQRREIADLVENVVGAGAARINSPDLVTDEGKPYKPEYVTDITANRARLATAFVGQFEETQSEENRQRAALFRLMLEAEQAAILDMRASGAYSSEAIEYAQRVVDTDLARSAQQGVI